MKLFKTLWVVLIALSFFSFSHLEARENSKKKTDLFLDYQELLELNLEERVEYLDNALDYVVLLEMISEKENKKSTKPKKNAYLNSINNFLDLLPQAHAIGGETCICATYAGMKPAGKSCNPIIPAHEAAKCEGKFLCNPRLFFIPGEGGGSTPICVSNGSCGSRSQSCLTEFRKVRNNGMTQAQFDVWARTASQGLTSLNMQALGAERVGARCASRPNDQDCATLTQLKAEITSTGVHVASTEERITQMQAAFDQRQAANGQLNTWTPKGLPGANTSYQAPSTNVLGPLECIASGLAQADPSTGGQVTEYIALMGIAAQTYDGGPFRTDTANGRTRLLENVIDRVSSYGYCTDSEFRSGALSDASSQGQIRDIIDGRQPMTSGWWIFKGPNSQLTTSVFAKFGIHGKHPPMTQQHTQAQPQRKCGFWARLFGRCSRTPAYTPAYSNQLFSDRGWSTAPQRQMRFRAETQGFQASYPNTPFSSCARAIQARGQKNPAFRMCLPKARTGSGFSLNRKSYEAQASLADKLYQACGLQPKARQIPRTCPEECHDSYAFGKRSSWLKGCRPPHQSEGGNGPDTPGGKGGEDSNGGGPGQGPGGSKGGEGTSGGGPGQGAGSGPSGGEGSSPGGGPGQGVK